MVIDWVDCKLIFRIGRRIEGEEGQADDMCRLVELCGG